MTEPLLLGRALTVELGPAHDRTSVITGLDFSLAAGRTLGVVGESGCGKSMTALAIMGLAPSPHRIGGVLRFAGQDLLTMPQDRRRQLRGADMAMIFQEPMTALNPVVPVGVQIAEMLIVHDNASETAAWRGAVALLDRGGIADPARRARAYPDELSGGMRQRVMIAMAIACKPRLLIADEPTTALDVSVQAQILDLLLELQRDTGMAMVFISHNLGVVSAVADDIMVMYAGRALETGPAQRVLTAPAHPYTAGLIATLPDIGRRQKILPVIEGSPVNPRNRPPGCAFAPRCPRVIAECRTGLPAMVMVSPGQEAACIRCAA
ncbi:MAG: ABC transporter ATP-binding protein [Acetobacteraceae bacterium]|nr:ABC transporter ATP-binding protein [Acetobacteraceae bacterium]